MIRKKHESSLLEVFSDAGSTPAASTIFNISIYLTYSFHPNSFRKRMPCPDCKIGAT